MLVKGCTAGGGGDGVVGEAGLVEDDERAAQLVDVRVCRCRRDLRLHLLVLVLGLHDLPLQVLPGRRLLRQQPPLHACALR